MAVRGRCRTDNDNPGDLIHTETTAEIMTKLVTSHAGPTKVRGGGRVKCDLGLYFVLYERFVAYFNPTSAASLINRRCSLVGGSEMTVKIIIQESSG